ncbi:MAG: prolipoprotein diacylglyceryl transferase [Deltaproteobacteria bacterium]|nr:prolipoprotein diacylglyceryl transferase [Deltaproteobacteria bacterium]
MWPSDISLGPFVIGGYALALILAIMASLAFICWTAPRARVSPKKALDLGFWLVLAGILGARAAYALTHPQLFKSQPLAILKYWEGGLTFQGGLFLGLLLVIALAALKRFPLLPMADALAPPLALGQAIGRLGCLMAGCCYGRLAPGFPLALTFPRGSLAPSGFPLYPTQAMEAIGLFLVTLFLARFLARPVGPPSGRPWRPAGLVLSLYLALTGLLRLVSEHFRGDNRGPKLLSLAPTAWAALAIFMAGLALLLFLALRQKNAPNNISWQPK